MRLDTFLLNTQQYKVRIKGKVKQSRERCTALHLGVVAIEKGAFWLPSTMVANLTYLSSVGVAFVHKWPTVIHRSSAQTPAV